MPFSPVVDDVPSRLIAPIISTSPMILHKRMLDKNETFGFADGAPKKRQKRKKDKENKNKEIVLDMLDDLRLQFQEVEMHELAVEST